MTSDPRSFHDLHYGDGPLLLPNAWDVGSAIAFIDAGFPAIGTTSFGVGAAAGHPDGARASKNATSRLAKNLAGLPVHISADIEDGYADDPRAVAEFVADLAVDGVNIEDSKAAQLIDPQRHVAKIAAIKATTPDVFVNARIDNYWFDQEASVDAVLTRANAYVAAGADCIFVPGVSAPATLRELAAGITVPVNVLLVPGRTLSDLAGFGIRRVSTGSLPYRAAMDAAVHAATSVRDGGEPVVATPYPEAQALLSRYATGDAHAE